MSNSRQVEDEVQPAMSEIGRRLVFNGRDRVEVERFDVPSPGPGQVLVRVHRSQVSAGSEKNGILSAKSSDVRRPLGYTTIGRVLEVGAGVDDLKPGDRVLTKGNHGSHWLATLGGPDVKSVHALRYEITDEQAAFAVLGEVALQGVRRAQLQIDESVAIYGQGVVGQLTTQLCRVSGAYPIIAIDLDDARLELAKKSGATHTINASKVDPVEAVRDLTSGGPSLNDSHPGGGAQCVFHVSRDPAVLVPVMKSAADRGKVILTGSPPGAVEIGLQVELLRWELDIRGVYGSGLDRPHPYWPYTRERNRRAIMRMIASGDLQVDYLISHVAKPEQATELYQKVLAGTEGWMSIFFDWESEPV